MFLIRSLRGKGTMVEVVQNGQVLMTPIHGMGSAESEKVTEDMRNQMKWGFISFTNVDAPAPPPPKPTPEPTPDPEPPKEDPPVVEDTDDEEESGFYSEDELSKLKKYELLDLVTKYELDVDTDQLRADLLADMMDYEIPKE